MASTPAACRDGCSRRHDGMKIAHVVADLLTALSTATSVPAGLDVALQRLLRLSGAEAGALEFDPPRGEPVVVVAAGPRGLAPELETALRALASPTGGPPATGRRRAAAPTARGGRRPRGAMVRRIA